MKVIYTDRFIPRRFDAITIGPVILIRPKCKDDIGLLEHEKVHVDQWKRTFGLFWVLYLFNRYRMLAEVEAYQQQLRYSDPNQAWNFALKIANDYKLNITADDALFLLRNYER